MTDRRFALLVALETGVAAFLRLPALDARGLWLDELFTARVVGREDWAGLVDEVARDVHPPGYFALLRLWTTVAGDSDSALRLPSVLAGTAAVAMAAAAARRLVGPAAGVFAGLWLAVAPFAAQLDREARANALLSLLGIAGVFLLAASRIRWVAYAAVAAGLCWIHPFGPFVLLAHGLWLGTEAVNKERPGMDLARWAVALLAAGLTLVPWSGVMLAQHRDFARDPWYAPPTADATAWILDSLAGGSTTVALVGLGGAMVALTRAPHHRAATLALAHLVALVGLPQLISAFDVPLLRDRNAVALVPALALATGAGLAALPPSAALLMAVVGGSTGVAVALRARADSGAREDWREVAAVVRDNHQPDDVIAAVHPDLWRHYLGPDLPLFHPPSGFFDAWLGRQPQRRTWLLEAHDLRDDRWAAFEGAGVVLAEQRFVGARVLLVDRSAVTVPIGDELGPPLRDDTGLHLYWSVSTRSAPLDLAGRCRIGVVGHGDSAGGEAARIALRWIVGDTTTSDTIALPESDDARLGSEVAVQAPAAVEIEFLNDGGGPEGGDRNAHIRRVFARCSPEPG